MSYIFISMFLFLICFTILEKSRTASNRLCKLGKVCKILAKHIQHTEFSNLQKIPDLLETNLCRGY